MPMLGATAAMQAYTPYAQQGHVNTSPTISNVPQNMSEAESRQWWANNPQGGVAQQQPIANTMPGAVPPPQYATQAQTYEPYGPPVPNNMGGNSTIMPTGPVQNINQPITDMNDPNYDWTYGTSSPTPVNNAPPAYNVPMAPIQPQPVGPPTGLIGSELALQGGFEGALSGLQGGASTALQQLQNAQNTGFNQINSGLGAGLGQLNTARVQGLNSINTGADQALENLRLAQTQGLDAINDPFSRAVAGFDPYATRGQQAFDLQGALSGAQGNAAQAQAFQNFLDSPGQSFLRERGERSVLNNAAATGGLGGGNVLKELTRFGQGLAAQDYQNQFNNLGTLSGMGLQARGQQGQLLGQQGALSGNLISSLGQAGANVNTTRGTAGASLLGSLGQAGAGLSNQAGISKGNLAASLGGQGAGISNQLGMNIANLNQDTARQLSQGRTRVGELQAQNIGNTAQTLSNLANQQGSGLADIVGVNTSNIAQLLQAAGTGDAAALERLGTILANQSVQAGSDMANQPIIQPQTIDYMNTIGTVADAAASGYNAVNS